MHACMHACAGSSVTALVERFANTHPSATEAEAMQSGFLPLFAVAGVDAIGADGRFVNNPSLQLMVHLLIDPVRAQMLLEASDVVEARSLGVATPATPVHVGPDSQQEDEEDEEDEDDEVELGVMHWHHHPEDDEEEEEEQEEGFVDTGGIHCEEEGEEEDLSIANEEEVEVDGVVRKAMQFYEEPAAKGAKRVYAQIEELESYIYIYYRHTISINTYIYMYMCIYIYIYIYVFMLM